MAEKIRIAIVNGPNLNLLGRREPSIYGAQSFEQYLQILKNDFPHIDILYFQSNHEGQLLDFIHEVGFSVKGIILNAGALTHTSIALADAVSAIEAAVIEVHISNVFARETFRHHSYIAAKAKGVISGFGMESYRLALSFLAQN